jgi:hypothetical protein
VALPGLFRRGVRLVHADAPVRGAAVSLRDLLIRCGIVIVCAVGLIAAWNLWGG